MKKIMNFLKLQNSLFGLGILVFAFMFVASPIAVSAEMLSRQLQLGMSGSDVSTLQVFLAKDSTIYPQGIISGYFGSLTKSAVSNFQARNGIANIGRVGPATLAAINSQMNGDGSSPTINSVSVSTSNTMATLNWNTNENASAIVYYSNLPLSMTEGSPTTAVTIGGSSLLVHTDLRTSHSANITSLVPNTTYYYIIYVKDGFGNESITWPSTFKTNQ